MQHMLSGPSIGIVELGLLVSWYQASLPICSPTRPPPSPEPSHALYAPFLSLLRRPPSYLIVNSAPARASLPPTDVFTLAQGFEQLKHYRQEVMLPQTVLDFASCGFQFLVLELLVQFELLLGGERGVFEKALKTRQGSGSDTEKIEHELMSAGPLRDFLRRCPGGLRPEASVRSVYSAGVSTLAASNYILHLLGGKRSTIRITSTYVSHTHRTLRIRRYPILDRLPRLVQPPAFRLGIHSSMHDRIPPQTVQFV